MKHDILIAGVGGQGILTIATILGRAALRAGRHVKQSEVHGMAQRGGAVQSHFRMSDAPIASDVIPLDAADLLVSMEPMEALRYTAWLAPGGWVLTNDAPIRNIPDYPPDAAWRAAIAALPRHFLLNGTQLAEAAGSGRALNIAMLGAASAFLDLPDSLFAEVIGEHFAAKGPRIVEINLKTFAGARARAQERRAEGGATPPG